MVNMFHDVSEHVEYIKNSLKEVKEDIKFLDNTRND